MPTYRAQDGPTGGDDATGGTSSRLRALWAKTHQTDPTLYHPLVCHMLDVAAVTGALWDDGFTAGTRALIRDGLSLPDDAAARAWLAYLAGLHDLGKASPAFQAKCPQRRAALEAQGFVFPPGVRASHGQVGACLIAEILKSPPTDCPTVDRRLASSVGKAIGGHHGILPTSGDLTPLTRASGEFGDDVWADARNELVSAIAWFADLAQKPGIAIEKQRLLPILALVAGIVSVADWIGSAEDHFPYCPDVSDVEGYAAIATERARSALHDTGWVGWSPAADAPSFRALFPFIDRPRPMQQVAVELAEQINEPAIVIIEAPTGEGKTEAALYLTSHFNHTLAQRGCYVGMPTQATANAMFTRFREYLEAAHPAQPLDLHLLHGQAALSDEYQQLRDISQVHDDDNTTGVMARAWFTHRKRGLLGPFAVGTGDQSFMGVLRTRHVFIRLFGLAGKTIILDEVHAYDTYTSTILDRLVSWLAALGSSVVILSATLPEHRRNALLAAYSGRDTDTPATAYPCITWVTAGASGSSGFEVSPRPPLNIEWVPDDRDNLAARLRDALAEGGCAACICNTVKSAQDTFRALGVALEGTDIEVDLFHARYPFEERQIREQRAVRRFGKDATDRPKRAVLVATQVIEQSLDIDFDLMVSEVAPIDLLIQRAGRLHRHAGRDRPDALRQPVLWLIEPGTDAVGQPDFGGSSYVYARYTLLRTLHELAGRDTIHVPQDVAPLIEAVYSEIEPQEVEASSEGREALSEAYSKMQQERQALNMRAREVVLKSPAAPVDVSHLTNRQLSDDEDPRTHPQLRAATRWADVPSTSVCIVFGDANACFIDPQHTRPVPLDAEPDRATTRALIGRTVSLTGWQVHSHFVDADVPAWRQNALLRHMRLVPLDDTGSYVSERFTLTLRAELGVVIDYAAKGGDVD